MSVTDPKTIDLIGIDKVTGDVVLTVTDHLDWSESDRHQGILQTKLNKYLAYIESGEILERYPDAGRRMKRIDVVLQYQPDDKGHEFLRAAAEIIEKAGFGFSVEVIDSRSHGQ